MNYWYPRLVMILILNFWLHANYALAVPFNPFEKEKFYFIYVIAVVFSIVFAMFITKRKYRLPRKHMMTFSLVCSTLCMILLSVKNLGSYTGEIVIEVLSKIFIGLGWASAVYVNITLLSSVYEEHFQVLFAILKAFGLAGLILGYIAIRFSSSLKGAYIAFAVISAVMIPFVITLSGDVSYALSAERYTLLDYIKKPV